MTRPDYVLFIYGLAFILLAVVVHGIGRFERDNTAWRWLKWFGVAHGISEWFDMVGLIWPAVAAYAFPWNIALTGLSFLFLCEFGRAGMAVRTSRVPGPWIYPLLLGIAIVRGFPDPVALDASMRHLLALPGGICAVWVLWHWPERGHPTGRHFRRAASAMAIYALAAGGITPVADVYPADTVNDVIFREFFGVPIQIVRALAATVIMSSIWRAYCEMRRATFTTPIATAGLRYEKASAFALVVLLGCVAVAMEVMERIGASGWVPTPDMYRALPLAGAMLVIPIMLGFFVGRQNGIEAQARIALSEERKNMRSAMLDRLARDSVPLSEILHGIATDVGRQGGMLCRILLVDEAGRHLIDGTLPEAALGAHLGLDIRESHNACVAAAHRDERVIVNFRDGIPDGCADCPIRAAVDDRLICWAEPIRVGGNMLGVYAFSRSMLAASETEAGTLVRDIDLMQEAVQLAALAIERKRTEHTLHIAASVHLAIGEAVAVMDADNRIIAINPAFTRLTGYTSREAVGQNPRLLNSGRHDAAFFRRMWQVLETTGRWQGEIWNRRKNGEIYPEWLSINTIYSGDSRVLRRVAMFSEITDQKRAEETIWRQANYDPLTGLPNRRLFLDRLEQEITKARRSGLSIALLFIDLDHFKAVNDTRGHQAGDCLLVEASHRISGSVRATDTVARLGGDEFTVIMAELADTDRVAEVAQAIVAALSAPYCIAGDMAHISASVGITVYPNDGGDTDSLLKNADQAMYAAKESGRNGYAYFTAALQESAQSRLQLCNDLHDAFDTGQFALHFQPIIDMASGRMVKAEALLRWCHPTRGMVSPADFIPLAEDSGLIGPIGDWVFVETIRIAQGWHAAGMDVQVSVNISSRQFAAGSIETNWLDRLREIGLPPACLAIEITESLLLDERSKAEAKLRIFRDAGIQVSLDDFGTGYSAMSYLKRFPLDFLKIDQSFVRDMVSDPSDQAIIEAIIVMAHKLGLCVIAEGVETAEQRDLLSMAGCDLAQGYLFSRPLPPDAFAALYNAREVRFGSYKIPAV